MKTKICSRCNQQLPHSSFHRNSRHRDGLGSACKKCVKIITQNRYKENKDQINKKTLAYYYTNKQAAQAWQKEYRENHPTETKVRRRRAQLRKLGTTLERYNLLLLEQSGKCAICDSSNRANRDLNQDHNHKTLGVRGLLCDSCNLGLGKFKDNIDVIERAIYYLSQDTRELDSTVRSINHNKTNRKGPYDYHRWLREHLQINIEGFWWLQKHFNNSCALCNIKEVDTPDSKLCVDHDHLTNLIRGLLCTNCNTGLGVFNDNQERLGAAILYLQQY